MTEIENKIRNKQAALAAIEWAFRKAHQHYLEACDRFRRCSIERDTLTDELKQLKQQQQRQAAHAEFIDN